MNKFFMTTELVNIFLLPSLVMVLLNIVIIRTWRPLAKSLNALNRYAGGVQRIHDGEIPRLGGLVAWIGIIFLYFSLKNTGIENQEAYLFLKNILLSSLPFFIISLKEDVFHNTHPLTRLLFMFLSVILFFKLQSINFPFIELPFLGELISSNQILLFGFFSIAIVTLMNGNNIIDGSNGHLTMTALTQMTCLGFICLKFSDYNLILILFILAIPLIIFHFFNYPWGKIFIGDSGAYLYGFLISIMTIIIFGKYQMIPAWSAVLILFYPLFEVFFSIIRKFSLGISPIKPDPNHLHLKAFYLLSNNFNQLKLANVLVMPFLFAVWGLPLIFTIFVYESTIRIIFAIIIMIFIYLVLYFVLPSKNT